MRDALAQARGAFLFAGEFPNDYDPHEKHKEADAYAHLFSGRFEPVRLAAREIETLRNEAEALWGRDVVTKLNRLLTAAKTLRVAQYAFVDKKREHGTIGNTIQSRLFDESFETDEQGNLIDKPNPFTLEIENAVEDLSAYLRTRLPKHS